MIGKTAISITRHPSMYKAMEDLLEELTLRNIEMVKMVNIKLNHSF